MLFPLLSSSVPALFSATLAAAVWLQDEEDSLTAVWLRLLKHCWRQTECRPRIYANMGHQLAGGQQPQQPQQEQVALDAKQGQTHHQQQLLLQQQQTAGESMQVQTHHQQQQQQQQSVSKEEHLQQLLDAERQKNMQQAQQIAELPEQLAAARAQAAV
jgi:hypothetical protein